MTDDQPLISNSSMRPGPRFGYLNALWDNDFKSGAVVLRPSILRAAANLLLTSPEPIYHYTDLDGLMGIVRSKGVWASHVRYLNDVEEIFHGRHLASRVLRSCSRRDAYQDFRPIVDLVLQRLERNDLPNKYVACFSLDGDNLDQWRGYCPDGGVSVEFDISKRNPFVAMPVMAMRKVTYGDLAKCKAILDVVKRFNSELGKDIAHFEGKLPDDHLAEYSHHLFSKLEYSFIGFKHSAFRNEREVRLIVHHDDADDDFAQKKFRSNGRFIVPYYSTTDLVTYDGNRNLIKPESLPIRRVIIGPSQYQEPAARSVQDFLRYEGYADCIVDVSKIPFRSLR